MSFHRFCTAILLVDSTHRFLSSSRVGIKLKWPKSKNFRLESPCQYDDSSAGFFVLLRVRLATDHIGSPSFVILTFPRFVMAFGRFDSSTKAPSTHIRIFLNAQLFLSGFKNFPVHTKRTQIEYACPHASDGIRIHSSNQGPVPERRNKL